MKINKRMQLILYRHTYNTKGDRNVIGDLFIDGVFFCHTLEDEIRSKGVKVYSKTCIDAGVYTVKVTMSNRFKRLMAEIFNVPRFTGIRIHGGNSSEDTAGCPLVAFKTDYKRIWSSAEKKLTNKLRAAKNDITIDIRNCPLSYDRKNKRLK